MNSLSQAPKGFAHELVREGERLLIQSTCEYCGMRIVGNADVIDDREPTHRASCAKPKGRTTAGK